MIKVTYHPKAGQWTVDYVSRLVRFSISTHTSRSSAINAAQGAN